MSPVEPIVKRFSAFNEEMELVNIDTAVGPRKQRLFEFGSSGSSFVPRLSLDNVDKLGIAAQRDSSPLIAESINKADLPVLSSVLISAPQIGFPLRSRSCSDDMESMWPTNLTNASGPSPQ